MQELASYQHDGRGGAVARSLHRPSSRIVGRPIQLLVIEDSPADADLLRELLDPREYALQVAPTVDEGLRLLAETSHDAVLLDLHLPGTSGLEALRALLAAGAPPVVVLTGLNDPDVASECLETGADDYLNKNEISATHVRRAISHALARRAARDLQRALEHSNRLALVGELAAGVAHEINNPLAFLQANLTMLGDMIEASSHGEAFDYTQGEKLISDCLQGVARVASIVRELGVFSREEEARGADVEAGPLCRHAASIAGARFKARTRLRLALDADATARRVPAKLEQALINLLVNAAQAVPESRTGEVVLTLRQTDQQLRIEVHDDGCGIPEERLGRIFDPFFTTKPAGVGTGLGLSITANLVARLGGAIEVESEVGRGSTFTIVLPFDSRPSRASEPPASGITARSTLRGRVLLVDDEPCIGRAIRRLLGSHHDIEYEPDARTALRRLRETPYDVVLCDLMMPGFDGADLYAAATRESPHFAGRFIFLTGGAASGHARDFLAATRPRVLRKPVDRETLLEAIARVLEALPFEGVTAAEE